MFREHLRQYYKFSTGINFEESNKLFFVENCTPTLYDFGIMKWMKLPESYKGKHVDYFSCVKLSSTTIVGFLDNRESEYGTIDNGKYCRKLSRKDKSLFDKFLEACNEEDKEAGQVSIEDPVVYGLIIDNKVVAASSLWHFGDSLSDIGVLTRPGYRRKGYAEAVCKTLIENEERFYVWRYEDNPPSKKLSKALGFTECGKISVVSL